MAEVLYGRNAVREALRAGRRSFQRLQVSSGAQEAGTLGEVVKLAEKAGVPITRVDRHELDRKLRDANHQGVALECGDYPYAELADCLALAERRHMELACEWPDAGRHPMPLLGDEHLLAQLLRNLLDNALRYAPAGTQVTLRFAEDRLEVENEGLPLTAQQLAHLGERFRRDEAQPEGGSGLGVSIGRVVVRRNGRPPDAKPEPAVSPPPEKSSWELVPWTGPSGDGRGLVLLVRF